jgi:hypothetical protein
MKTIRSINREQRSMNSSFAEPSNTTLDMDSSPVTISSSSTGLAVGTHALDQAEDTQNSLVICLGALMLLGLITTVMVVRNFEKVKSFCAELNLFGGPADRTRRNRASIPETQRLLGRKANSDVTQYTR